MALLMLGRSRVALLCLLAAGCSGGPISDFPKNTAGEEGPGYAPVPAGQGTDDSSHEPPPPSDHDGDDGDSAGAPADYAADAGAPLGDGGTEDIPCGESDAPDAGTCTGEHCGLTRADLARMAAPGAACATHSQELELVCRGEISRAVSSCSEQSVLETADFSSVNSCTLSAPALEAASDDCIECYLDENRCTLRNCLAECLLASTPDACAECRRAHCGDALSACTGLPPF